VTSTQRKPLFAGNWKMNLAPLDAAAAAGAVLAGFGDRDDAQAILAPTFVSIPAVVDVLRGSAISVAGQNCHWESSGAFTGEVTAEMLKAAGCSHVILGHSERRQFFGETDETVKWRFTAAHRAGLSPIVCVGETLAEREARRTLDVIERQLLFALSSANREQMLRTIVAYEPVWAIGTGKVATPGQAQEAHAFLRKLLANRFDEATAAQIRILYGGSVKPDNIAELMSQPDIDGALIGGASLKPESFLAIVENGCRAH